MKVFLQRHPYWLFCMVSIVFVSGYWGFWASDRYVSQSNVVLESPQLVPAAVSFSSLLGGASGGSGDMLLLRDYLLSVDMLRKIDIELGFREHYASTKVDFFSRLVDIDAPVEELHEYYLQQISVELDDYAQILRIRVRAFDPNMAYLVANMLLSQGEAHMNAMGQRLAEEQVNFLEQQVNHLSKNFDSARKALIEYQNENGLISPMGTVESLSAVVASLEAQLANLKAKRTALISYQSALSPAILKVNREIKAVKEQISQESARMAQQSGGALNVVFSEYQALELKVQFSQESYSAALAALENTRIEAARKLKQVSVLQTPTFPEYSIEPKRIYNIMVFSVVAIFLSLIIHMLMLIIREHSD